MLPNRLGHVFSEPSAEPFAAAQLVAVINAARRRLAAELVDQMSNVMQQRGGDQRRIGAGLLGQSGALRRVLEDSGAKLFQRPVSKNCADFGLAIEQ